MNDLQKYTIIFEEICKKITPGKKILQKLIYLMERNEVDLSLNYSIHFFGPYSSKLDNIMHVLENMDIIDINTNGATHKISMNEYEKIDESLTSDEMEKIMFVLDNFVNRSPLELEAITTLDYVAKEILDSNKSDEEVIKTVKIIKGTKFSDEYLKNELEVLKSTGYLCCSKS